MKKKGNAAQVEEHPGGSYEQMVFRDFFEPKPRDDSTIPTAKKQPKPEIAWLIGVGAQNAIGLKTLVKITGRRQRDIRRAIQRDRAAGFPICCDNIRGYFLPATESEKLSCVRSMLHRSAEIRRTARNIESGAVIDADVGGNSGQQETTISEKNI